MDLFRELFFEAEPISQTAKAIFYEAQLSFDADLILRLGRLEAVEGLWLIFDPRNQTLTFALSPMGLLKRALLQLRSPLPLRLRDDRILQIDELLLQESVFSFQFSVLLGRR